MRYQVYAALVCLIMSSLLDAKNHYTFYVGPQHAYQRLEFNNPNELGGYVTGAFAGFKYKRSWFFSKIHYENLFSTGLSHGNPCQTSKVHEHLAGIKLGAHWKVNDCFCLKGYTGFGYNHLSNRQDPAANGGLLYKYMKLFVPFGIGLKWRMTDYSKIGLKAEWRPDVFARLHVLCDSHLDNDREHAFRIGLPFKHTLKRNEHVGIGFMPFFDWSRFGRVCTTDCNGSSFALPQLTRWNLGFKLFFGFKF